MPRSDPTACRARELTCGTYASRAREVPPARRASIRPERLVVVCGRDRLRRASSGRGHLAGLRAAGRAAQRRLGRLLVHGASTPRASVAPRRRRKIAPRRSAACARVAPTPRSSTTARPASAGASSARRTSFRASSASAPISKGLTRSAGLADHLLLRRQGVSRQGRRVGRPRRRAGGDRPPRRRHGGELSRSRRRPDGLVRRSCTTRPSRCSSSTGSSAPAASARTTGSSRRSWPNRAPGPPDGAGPVGGVVGCFACSPRSARHMLARSIRQRRGHHRCTSRKRRSSSGSRSSSTTGAATGAGRSATRSRSRS